MLFQVNPTRKFDEFVKTEFIGFKYSVSGVKSKYKTIKTNT